MRVVVVVFHLGLLIVIFACTYYLLRVFFFLLVAPHPPTYTHPLRGFCADAHCFPLSCWWVVLDNVQRFPLRKWLHFGDPGKSNIVCCHLILFMTQSGSCILRPPRLLLSCFPLHRRQISSDITSSALSSTAAKRQTSKGLAWRLNKSAWNSVNAGSMDVALFPRIYYGWIVVNSCCRF